MGTTERSILRDRSWAWWPRGVVAQFNARRAGAKSQLVTENRQRPYGIKA